MPSSIGLYLPKEWTDDPERLKAAHVPDEVGFATKPQIARAMIARAVAAQIPFTFVAANAGMWGRDEQETLRKLKEWNQPIHRVRGRIEKIFGTGKRSYGLRRMRWRGFATASLQVRITAAAYNLKRTMNILAAQA